MELLDSRIAREFSTQNAQSGLHAQRAGARVPTGMSRALLRHAPFAAYTARAEGVYSTDLDGNRRLDFHGNYAALIHGHAHPAILAATRAQLERGTAYSTPAAQELALAEHLCERVHSIERVVFNNSGTEAVLMALRAARAFTGRHRIAKIEGGYHGFSDFVMVGGHDLPPAHDRTIQLNPHADTAGLPPAATADVILLRYNDFEGARRALREHGDELAAVIVEPMLGSAGVIPASPEFLEMLRTETARTGTLLICDEVISLRQAHGGLQATYGLIPDLTTMAKIIGGGFPMGAVGGRAEVMSVFEKPGPQYVAHLGTFSANPVSLTAGLAALELLDEKAIDRLNSLGARARVGIEKVIKDRSLPACVTGLGSMFQVHWTRGPVREARHAESAVSELKILTFLGLSNRGIQTSMRGMCSLSTPMSEEHIDTLVSAFADTVADLEAEGWLNR